MVTPIGPQKVLTWDRNGEYFKRIWRTQKRPYTLALPTIVQHYRLAGGSHTGVVSRWYNPSLIPASLWSELYSKHTSRVRGRTASLGTFVGELGETSRMIVSRAQSLYWAARFTKNREFGRALRALSGMGYVPKKAPLPKAKDPANAWLEMSYGWSPALADLLDTYKVFTDPYLGFTVGTVVQGPHFRVWLYGPVPGRAQWIDGSWQLNWNTRVRVTSPNVLLLNQLGLLNPIGIAWQLVPWSFLVDRFVNVSACLNKFTDYAGLEILSSSYGQLYDGHEYYDYQGVRVWDVHGRTFERIVGQPSGPTLSLKPARFPSISEGANWMALLAQQLKSF